MVRIDEKTEVAIMKAFFYDPSQTMKALAERFKTSTNTVSRITSMLIKMPDKERRTLFGNHRIMQKD